MQYSLGFQGLSAVSTYNQKCHVVHHLAFCFKETEAKNWIPFFSPKKELDGDVDLSLELSVGTSLDSSLLVKCKVLFFFLSCHSTVPTIIKIKTLLTHKTSVIRFNSHVWSTL